MKIFCGACSTRPSSASITNGRLAQRRDTTTNKQLRKIILNRQRRIQFVALVCLSITWLQWGLQLSFAQVVDKQNSSAQAVSFDDQIAPIFRKHCVLCHGDVKRESGLNLSQFSSTIAGGSGGPVVIAQRTQSSRLFQVITAADPSERMPPEADPLAAQDIESIKRWIEQGLAENFKLASMKRKLELPAPKEMTRDGKGTMPKALSSFVPLNTKRVYPVLDLATSPNAPLLVSCSYESSRCFDLERKQIIGSFPFPEGEPHVISFNSTGNRLLVAGGRPVENGVAVLFDVQSGQRVAEFGYESDSVMAATLANDERRVAIGGSNRVVTIFSTQNEVEPIRIVKHTDWVTALSFSPDNKLLASGDRAGNIYLWAVEGGGLHLSLAEHKAAIKTLVWKTDSRALVSCGEDGQIIWWDVEKGWPTLVRSDAHPPDRPAGTFGRIANGVLDIAIGPGGDLASCGRDKKVRYWSNEGTLLDTFTIENTTAVESSVRHTKAVPLCIGFQWDGKMIVAGDSLGQIHQWTLKGGP